MTLSSSQATIGEPLPRVDGRAKVIGKARYAAEFQIPRLVYAVMATSTIPAGKVTGFDTDSAKRAAGVLMVITPQNAYRLPGAQRRVTVLQDNEIFYNNQPIAVVVAEQLHQAQHAASLLKPQFSKSEPKINFQAGFPSGYPGSHTGEPGDMSWGDVDGGLAKAEVTIDQTYTTPIQHHNPMEPHATIAQWDGDKLTVYDATQHITGLRGTMAKFFGIPPANVHVISDFVGGGFGCKGQVWSHVILAAMAAKQVGRPAKLVVERPQMFASVGARPCTEQRLIVGATREGKLTAVKHHVYAHTSRIEDYLESSAFPTRVMYDCPNISTTHRLVPLNLGTPTYMRAPGVATGTYALEVAMDELAYKLNMDPLQLRLLNYAEVDPQTKKPFTEKNLRQCYQQASEKFGWSKRNHEPRSMRKGNQLIGWGMATETYPGKRLPSGALVRIQPNGRVLVAAGTQEIGTGMYTLMTQVASDVLGIPPSMIDAKLGDTDLPEAPISAGSMSTVSVMPAVQAAANEVREKLALVASQDQKSPLFGTNAQEIQFRDGKVSARSSGKSEDIKALISRNSGQGIESTVHLKPNMDPKENPCHSFGAVFAEVSVDADLCSIRVPRIVAVFDVGKIMNAQTAKSQFIGGIVWGISLALFEDTQLDERYGRFVNGNLEKYLVPVNADIGDINVTALDIPEPKLDSLGARGIGEIGITGTGAAVANAIYHATGKRVRDLPITPDKLL
jgi:xanthine dehydrogenase YagR molybdenum-binding subunit